MEKIHNFHTIAKKLEDRRRTLLALLEQKQAKAQIADVVNPHKDDRVMAFRKNNLDKRLLNRTERQLHNIELSLEKLDYATFFL